jgi:fimbrial chaperone protein
VSLRINRAALAIVAAVFSTAATATTLQVTPISVESLGGSTETVTLSNTGNEPLNAQVRVYKWTQRDGQDVLEPTRELLASPPIASIAAGSSQVVRVVRPEAPAGRGEATYRLLIEQLPDHTSSKQTGVNFLMRYSVPVFFGAGESSSKSIQWRLERRGNALRLTGTNSGTRRIRVSELSIVGQSGDVIVRKPGLVGYVLSGSTATWNLSAGSVPKGTVLTLEATGDVGPIKAQVVTE